MTHYASFMTTRLLPVTNTRAFTLIEALIYLALMSVIITGAIASAYPLFTNTGRSSVTILRDLESMFVFQKVSYLMNQASAITTPSSGAAGDTLTLVVGGDAYEIELVDGAVTLTINGGERVPLTASRVDIENLTFTREAGSGGTPDTLRVDFDANEVPQGPFTRYVRF